jgi:hypothetical protein
MAEMRGARVVVAAEVLHCDAASVTVRLTLAANVKARRTTLATVELLSMPPLLAAFLGQALIDAASSAGAKWPPAQT